MTEKRIKEKKGMAAFLISRFQPGIEIFARACTQFQTERRASSVRWDSVDPSPIDAFCPIEFMGWGILLVNIVICSV